MRNDVGEDVNSFSDVVRKGKMPLDISEVVEFLGVSLLMTGAITRLEKG
jgi:hypothetical protein